MATKLSKLRSKLQKLTDRGKWAKALKVIGQVEAMQPGNPHWPKKRGEMLQKLGHREDAIDAFVQDEESMNRPGGELIPLADRALEGMDGEPLVFDCEWIWGSITSRISAIYVPIESGRLRSLWLVTAEDTPFETLQAELEATLLRLDEPSTPALPERYSALLNDHTISFNLCFADEIRLRPVEMVEADHADFVHQILAENTEFFGSHARQWQDEERGTKLSYQVVVHDLNLGPDPAFLHWLSSVFQLYLREDKEKGDVPVELIHLERARTEVVDDQTLKRHFENNVRASAAGVILEVVLPRSPYARARRLSWVRAKEDGSQLFSRAWSMELRHYHRVRGEIVTRVAVVMLRAEARSQADIDLMEANLDFASQPLDRTGRFPVRGSR